MGKFTDKDNLAILTTRLRRRARRLGAQPCDAEDMVQETLLRLMQRMARIPVTRPEHYAMIILHNIARRRWRRALEDTELQEDSATTLPDADGRLAVASVRRAIRALPAEQAQIMALVLHGELSPKDIAIRLDLPLGTVMSRLARARAKLRHNIGLEAGAPVSELL